MKRAAVSLIRLYRAAISSRSLPACRYVPSCSHYSEEAISRYGVFKGSWLTAKRLARCHPFHHGGFDPVP